VSDFLNYLGRTHGGNITQPKRERQGGKSIRVNRDLKDASDGGQQAFTGLFEKGDGLLCGGMCREEFSASEGRGAVSMLNGSASAFN